MHRRTLLKGTGGLAMGLLATRSLSAMAEDAPASETFPALTITVTDDGFVIPEGTVAGRYAVTVANESTTPSHSSLGLLPEGTDPDMVAEAMTSDSEDVPQWVLDTRWVGLPDWGMPGESRTGIVDFLPGTYLGFSPFLGWFNLIEIGGAAFEAADPIADVSVELVEMGFDWSHETVPAGPQLLKVTNIGTTLHDIQFLAVPDGTTVDHAMEAFMVEDAGGTPSPDNPLANIGDEFAPAAATSIVAPGVTTWISLDLAPGSYLVMCPLPFPSGPPHAFLGMMEIVTVG